ncbi:MAG: HAD-IA family hydrolase [Akkermansiaceae bacterium]
MIRGLIFDLDGTLVDSLPGIATALNHALEDLDLPKHPQEAVETFIGDGVRNLVIRALGKDHANRQEDLLAAFQKHYSADWKTGTQPYPGFVRLLEELQQRKIPMAVLSNKPHEYTVEIVETLFPQNFFTPVQGHQEDYPKKPDPTTAHQIISDWNLKPEEVAYVGDSTVDLATARNGNMTPLIFSWGYGTPENFPLLESIDDFRSAIAGAEWVDTASFRNRIS